MSATRSRRAKEAARKRAYRKRLSDGGGSLIVPVQDLHGVIDALLCTRWLQKAESEDRAQIGRAIGAMLDDLAAWKRSCPAWTDEPVTTWHAARRHDITP